MDKLIKKPGKSPRRATNISLPSEMVEAAKALGINLSGACESGLASALKTERERRWSDDHREAIEANNAWVEQHGLPLAKYRMF